MSVRTPILTLTCCALAVPHVRMMARAARLIFRFIDVSSYFAPLGLVSLDTEIVMQFVDVCIQFRVGKLVDDTTMFHDVIAVRNGRGEPEVLFHQKDRKALILKSADRLADLLNYDRCETFGRLVQQQKTGAGPQNTPNRQHLLFATGQFRALTGTKPLLEVRKEFENLIETEAARLNYRRKQQILFHVETCKDTALFRTEGDAGAGDMIRVP